MPTIISSTRLRNDYNSVSEQCHATDEPVFITRNGNGDLALMSMEAYDRLIGVTELRSLLLQAHINGLENGFTPYEEFLDELREEFPGAFVQEETA